MEHSHSRAPRDTQGRAPGRRRRRAAARAAARCSSSSATTRWRPTGSSRSCGTATRPRPPRRSSRTSSRSSAAACPPKRHCARAARVRTRARPTVARRPRFALHEGRRALADGNRLAHRDAARAARALAQTCARRVPRPSVDAPESARARGGTARGAGAARRCRPQRSAATPTSPASWRPQSPASRSTRACAPSSCSRCTTAPPGGGAGGVPGRAPHAREQLGIEPEPSAHDAATNRSSPRTARSPRPPPRGSGAAATPARCCSPTARCSSPPAPRSCCSPRQGGQRGCRRRRHRAARHARRRDREGRAADQHRPHARQGRRQRQRHLAVSARRTCGPDRARFRPSPCSRPRGPVDVAAAGGKLSVANSAAARPGVARPDRDLGRPVRPSDEPQEGDRGAPVQRGRVGVRDRRPARRHTRRRLSSHHGKSVIRIDPAAAEVAASRPGCAVATAIAARGSRSGCGLLIELDARTTRSAAASSCPPATPARSPSATTPSGSSATRSRSWAHRPRPRRCHRRGRSRGQQQRGAVAATASGSPTRSRRRHRGRRGLDA